MEIFRILLQSFFLLFVTPSVDEFQKEALSFQEEAESYYLTQSLLAKEYARASSPKALHAFLAGFGPIDSITFVEKKQHDLVGWTEITKDPVTGELFGLCISPVYNTKKKTITGYLVGKYAFQTKLKTAAITSIDGIPPTLHERLKYSHSWMILPALSSAAKKRR